MEGGEGVGRGSLSSGRGPWVHGAMGVAGWVERGKGGGGHALSPLKSFDRV